jgi:hypothetical protein
VNEDPENTAKAWPSSVCEDAMIEAWSGSLAIARSTL